MTLKFTESELENLVLGWLESLGRQVKHGPEIAPGTLEAERDDFGQVVLAPAGSPFPELIVRKYRKSLSGRAHE